MRTITKDNWLILKRHIFKTDNYWSSSSNEIDFKKVGRYNPDTHIHTRFMLEIRF